MSYKSVIKKQQDVFDEKFLSKEIFIADGPDAGFTTLANLIQELGPSYFSMRYSQGTSTWDYDHRAGRWVQIHFDPFVIVFADSLGVVDPIGALCVYRRHQKESRERKWLYAPGYKPSTYQRCRRPQVVGIMRQASLVLSEEGEMPHHPKIRSMDTYGVRRSCNFNRNWKRFRKTQHRDGA